MLALVVDQTVSRTPLDLPAALGYLALFACVAGVVVRRPGDAVLALIATAPFAFYRDIGPTTLTFGKTALLAALVGLAIRRVDLRALRMPPARVLLGATLALVAATALTLAVASDRGAALRETFKAIQYLLTFVVALVAWRCDPDVRRLRAALLMTTAAVALAALAQEITGAPSGVWFDGRPFPRIAGPLEGPNQLAGYLGVVLPFAVAFALERRDWLALVTTLLASATLLLTLSRSGTIAALAGIAIVVVLRRTPATARVIASVAGGALAAGAVMLGWHASAAGARFISFAEVEHSGGVGTRTILWHSALALWRAHPLLGVGAGNFERLLPTVAPAGIRTHANSWYLQALAEGGLVLLAATLALVYASIVPLAGALRKPLVLAAFAASVAFALHGIYDLMIFFPKVATTWFVVLGIAVVERSRI